MKHRILSAVLAASAAMMLVAAAVTVPASPAVAIPVFDAGNYAQNVLQAARTLQQINQQVQALQNQAAMLRNMATNLQKLDYSSLGEMTSTLQKIDRLMGQAQGVDFKVDALDDQFRKLFPNSFDAFVKKDARIANANARLDAAMSGFRQTMGIQSQVVENVRDDAKLLAELVERSQGAAGGLEAQQAANQLLALTAKQQFQLQTMMAAQFRSEAMEQATRAQAASEARAATKRFLGTGKAYTPQ